MFRNARLLKYPPLQQGFCLVQTASPFFQIHRELSVPAGVKNSSVFPQSKLQVVPMTLLSVVQFTLPWVISPISSHAVTVGIRRQKLLFSYTLPTYRLLHTCALGCWLGPPGSGWCSNARNRQRPLHFVMAVASEFAKRPDLISSKTFHCSALWRGNWIADCWKIQHISWVWLS